MKTAPLLLVLVAMLLCGHAAAQFGGGGLFGRQGGGFFGQGRTTGQQTGFSRGTGFGTGFGTGQTTSQFSGTGQTTGGQGFGTGTGMGTGLFYFAQMNGQQNIPPVNSRATARFEIFVDLARQRAFYTYRIMNVVNYMVSHIHAGAVGMNGVPIFMLNPMTQNINIQNQQFTGTITPQSTFMVVGASTPTWQSFVRNLQTGQLYVNLHTVANPDGEIRGQLMQGTFTGSPAGMQATQG